MQADKAGLKVLATLAVLPPLCFERLEHLDLAEWCSGPVLAALSRFKRLHTLLISGNGADIDWQGRGAAAVASKLRQLTLDCQGPHCPHAYEEEDDVELFDSDFPTSILSRSAAQSVLAATALSSLELVLDWTDDVAALCRGLPALRSLRWVGRWGGRACGVMSGGLCMGAWRQPPVSIYLTVLSELSHPSLRVCSLEVSRVRHGHMEAAVSMLHALTGLTGIRLGFSVWPAGHSCQLTWEGDMFDVPSLGGLAQLIELRLHAVILPPDWRQLSNLQRLSWNDIWHREGGEADGVYHISRGWHRDPLTALTALTALELGLVFEFGAWGTSCWWHCMGRLA